MSEEMKNRIVSFLVENMTSYRLHIRKNAHRVTTRRVLDISGSGHIRETFLGLHERRSDNHIGETNRRIGDNNTAPMSLHRGSIINNWK